MLFTLMEVTHNDFKQIIESLEDIDLKPDAYLTSLLYAYNRSLDTQPPQVVIGDIPTLVHRD